MATGLERGRPDFMCLPVDGQWSDTQDSGLQSLVKGRCRERKSPLPSQTSVLCPHRKGNEGRGREGGGQSVVTQVPGTSHPVSTHRTSLSLQHPLFRQISYDNTYVGSNKNGTSTLIYNTEIEAQT